MNEYDRKEISPQRRVELLGDLSAALKDLAERVGGVKSWPQRMLACAGHGLSESEKYVWAQIDHVEVCKESQTRFFLIRIIQAIWDRLLQTIWIIVLYIAENSAVYQFKECAFRTIKKMGICENLVLDPKLSGGISTLAYKGIQKDLHQFLEDPSSHLGPKDANQLRDLLGQLEFGEKLAFDQLWIYFTGQLLSRKTSQEKAADLAYTVEKKIESLGIGQSLCLPGGFIQNGSGHAIVFEIQRTDEQKFQFAIYNTGAGAYHGQEILNLARMVFSGKIQPIAFHGLTKEAISNSEFLTNLLYSMIDNHRDESDPMETLLSRIEEHCLIDNQAKKKFLNAHPLQTWGTCTFDSIRSYLQQKLNPALFARLESHMIQTAHQKLIQLLPAVRASGVIDADTLDLVEKKSQAIFQTVQFA